ncbi:MAG: hypothetical protein KDA87_20340 [Planctomycetales bacterium]|nr:hypothetical protein [Planctomycetales bacterium]
MAIAVTLLLASDVRAAVYVVDTWTEFADAVDAMNDTNLHRDEDVTIEVASGTILYPPSFQQVTIAPPVDGNSKAIKAASTGSVLVINCVWLIDSTANVTIEGLDFVRTIWTLPGSAAHQSGLLNIWDSEDVEILDCSFDELVKSPPSGTIYRYITLHGDSNKVENCSFESKDSVGDCIYAAINDTAVNTHSIRYCDFYGPIGGHSAIRLGTTKRNPSGQVNAHLNQSDGKCLIYRCVFADFDDSDSEVISSKSDFNRFIENSFLNCKSFLTLRTGDHCTVFGNRFIGGEAGLRINGGHHTILNNYFGSIAGSDSSGLQKGAVCFVGGRPSHDTNAVHYEAAHHCTFAFNTINDSKRMVMFCGYSEAGGWATEFPHDNVIEHNILYSQYEFLHPNQDIQKVSPQTLLRISTPWHSPNPPSSAQISAWQSNTIEGNLLHSNGHGKPLVNDVATWGWIWDGEVRKNLLEDQCSHAVTLGSSGDWTPDPVISGAVDMGWNWQYYQLMFSLYTDFDGISRSGPYDLGCHEVQP